MTQIENKQTSLALKFNPDNTPIFAGYNELIKLCMNRAPATGLTINDMRSRFKLIDKIEELKEDELLTVTPEELAIVKGAVLSFKWAQPHKDVVDFGEYIEGLK